MMLFQRSYVERINSLMDRYGSRRCLRGAGHHDAITCLLNADIRPP